MGVAVSLTGVEAGAVMIQGTMNGYGERNGNANLTTIIPNLELKMERKTNCGINLSKLRDLSLFIDDSTNLRPDIRAPYVGAASCSQGWRPCGCRIQVHLQLRAY